MLDLKNSIPEDFGSMDSEAQTNWIQETTRQLLEQALDVALERI